MRDRALEASIATTRFGLGARPGEIAEAKADPRNWLKSQITRRGADEPQGALPDIRAAFRTFVDYRRQVQAAKGDPEVRKQANQPVLERARKEILARAQLAAGTPASFRERWTLFWANHFTVSAKAVQVAVAVGPFEREAIRPNVFGRFETLLTAATRHPGMLLYLDQTQSIGPGSMAGQRRQAGLNENLAREILELHTVGADAGYSQADVTEFARALTGWSMGGPNAGPAEGAYLYRAAMHEPGARSVMGKTYGPGQEDQATRILADLAANPRTARRLARKIAVHFVADQPPPALVARLETAYIASDGDLAEVAMVLIDGPEAWIEPQAKFKTPYELVMSGYRSVGRVPTAVVREVNAPLTLLGQTPFRAPQPNGWSDLASDWAAPDAIVKRLTWATAFAAAFAPSDPLTAADQALGARLSPPVKTAMARAESREEAFALLLMSPEFQRR
jgi:uncharacterized protein (DUF1800 family)